jgi:serine/threonine kinase 16
MPLVSKHRVEEEEDADAAFNEDEEIPQQENGDPGTTVHVPYAHRDLKPGYHSEMPFPKLTLTNSSGT